MKELYELLLAKNYTIASCESLTGGLFTARMTEVPHVSQVLKGGICSYWNEIKENVVGVKRETIDSVGVVSKETAYEMALNVQKKFNVNVEKTLHWHFYIELFPRTQSSCLIFRSLLCFYISRKEV